MKKNVFLIFTLLGFAVTMQAQIRKIPSEVTDAFAARYPHAAKVSWKDNITVFEAQFILNAVEMSADFNGSGEWESSEKKIIFEDLPELVKDGFSKSKYIDWIKGSVVQIEKAEKPLQYRVFVRKSALEKRYLYFDTDGKLDREALTL